MSGVSSAGLSTIVLPGGDRGQDLPAPPSAAGSSTGRWTRRRRRPRGAPSDVWSAEYSPVARPSRLRAAPAKNAMLSIVPGTSKPVERRIGLPVCRVSVRANRVARSLQHAGEPVQHGRSLGGGGPGPAGQGLTRGEDGGVDVGRAGERDLLDGRTGGRIDHRPHLTRGAGSATAGDPVVTRGSRGHPGPPGHRAGAGTLSRGVTYGSDKYHSSSRRVAPQGCQDRDTDAYRSQRQRNIRSVTSLQHYGFESSVGSRGPRSAAHRRLPPSIP